MNSTAQENGPMRAAAFIAAGIFAAGLYLALAAAMAFTPTWIGLGTLAIAATVGIGIVVEAGRPGEPPPGDSSASSEPGTTSTRLATPVEAALTF